MNWLLYKRLKDELAFVQSLKDEMVTHKKRKKEEKNGCYTKDELVFIQKIERRTDCYIKTKRRNCCDTKSELVVIQD